jgi:hypothetical protein
VAIAYLKHTPMGKTTQAQPYTTAAHARYIMRKGAATRIFSERMPRQYHAVQRYLHAREDSIRKNGRVADKFIIAIPREFNQEQAEDILRRWGEKVSHSRAPYLFAFHWNDHNPHAHCIFIDADCETGRRVFGTSERRSTESLKYIWADTVNTRFKELGIEAEIEFGELTEELEKEFEQAANDNVKDHIADTGQMISEPLPPEIPAAEPTPDVVSEASPLAEPAVADTKPTLEELDNDLGRVDYIEELEEALARTESELAEIPDVDESVVDLDPEDARVEVADAGQDKVQQAVEFAVQLRRIREHIKERQTIRNRYKNVVEMKNEAQDRLREIEQLRIAAEREATEAKDTYVTEHRGFFGKRGFQISAFGFEYVSPARKAADAAEKRFHEAVLAEERAKREAQEAVRHAQAMEHEFNQASADLEKVQGTDQEISDAELYYERGVRDLTQDLTPERIEELMRDDEISLEEAAELLEVQGYIREAEALRDRDRGH